MEATSLELGRNDLWLLKAWIQDLKLQEALLRRLLAVGPVN